GIDGRLWVLTSREKTETSSNIPLLPRALEIIGRYADYPPVRGKGAGASGIEQPKDEQLPERDCRPVRHHQKADVPHGAAHIRHRGDTGQQRAYRNGFQNAGAYQHQDHPALCQAAGYADRQRHGGLAEAACRNVTENYSYFYPCTTKQNNEAKRR